MQVLRTILSGRRHWRIFLSAFAGVVFVLSLLLVMNQAFQASLIATLSSMNEEYGERADAIAGTMTDLIQTSAMQIYYSPSIKPLRSHASLTNAQRTAGLRLLGTSISSSEFIVSAVIYNPQRDRIYSSDGYAISLVDDYADESAKELLLNPPDIPHTTPIKRTSGSASYYSFLFYEKDNPQSGVLLLDVNAAWYERQLMGISPGVNSAFLPRTANISPRAATPSPRKPPLCCRRYRLKRPPPTEAICAWATAPSGFITGFPIRAGTPCAGLKCRKLRPAC